MGGRVRQSATCIEINICKVMGNGVYQSDRGLDDLEYDMCD